jgi:hypothetical protein
VVVEAEKITDKDINMTITVTRVYTWDELCGDLTDTALTSLEYIEIANDLTAAKTAELRGSGQISSRIVKAEKDVTIKRGSSLKDPLFKILSSLTLEGKITIDGDKGGSGNDSTSALLNVEAGGHLIIRDEVTLRNNNSIDGGGVYVKRGGRFTMSGGTISGNTAGRGGGVFVENTGFTKTGGTIYGFNSGSLSNQASVAGGGYAVYYYGQIWDDTLSTGDNLSQ